MKKIVVLGSTGSIGQNTLKVAQHLGRDKVEVKALAAKEDIDQLEIQAKKFHPDIIAVYNTDKALELQKRLPSIKVVGGMEGLEEVASYSEANMVISTISGTLGLQPTLAAIRAGKDIGLANKESLVSGGSLVMGLVKKHNVQLIPIDSEHSAIFQCLNGESYETIDRLILTSSGGPFRTFRQEQLENITVEQALNHPTWKMGPKVTIDSSTLMNKGLEVIEAHWLFGVSLDRINVVIHPQSIIHSLVEFNDGSMKAQLSEPTMIIPIQYALTYPKRYPGLINRFDFLKHSQLQFYLPDLNQFRCLHLAFESIKKGGTLPCYMNAANEVLVERFLKNQISWIEIAKKLEIMMDRHKIQPVESFETILEVDAMARKEALHF